MTAFLRASEFSGYYFIFILLLDYRDIYYLSTMCEGTFISIENYLIPMITGVNKSNYTRNKFRSQFLLLFQNYKFKEYISVLENLLSKHTLRLSRKVFDFVLWFICLLWICAAPAIFCVFFPHCVLYKGH